MTVCREGWSAGESAIAILTFAGFTFGLAVTLAASELFARGLTRLGTKLGFSEGLLGLLAALGADSPELSSAVIALLAGAGSVGVGVVVGSNLFNLAALLGLSAIVARGVTIRRGPLILDAAVGLLVTLAAAAMVGGVESPVMTAAIIFPIAAAYVVVLAVPRGQFRSVVPKNVVEIPYEATHDLPRSSHESWVPVLLLPLALAGVVAGSFVTVHEALAAQAWLHIPDAVVGTIVLAALTSLPNLYVALHFARTSRGTALFSSAMNSNTINLVGGLIVPALWIGTGSARGSMPYFIWLIDLTLLAVVAPLPRSRLSRGAGAIIIAIYLIFVVLRVLGI